MAKWKYGSYEFRINPNAVNSTVQVIGDNVRTLTGAPISQPTGTRENYSVESVFYQPRTRTISDSSLVADCMDWYNKKFYAINKANNRVDVYNSNMGTDPTITLAAITNKNFTSLDVVSDGIWVLCRNVGVEDYITKIDFTGTITVATKTLPITGGQNITDIEVLSGNMFAIRGSKIEKLTIPALTKLTEITPPSSVIKGLSSDGKYLLLGANDVSWGNIIYHIDIDSGMAINAIANDQLRLMSDLAYDGTYYYGFGANKIQKIQGNTTMVDIYNLEKEIVSYGFANLVDDIGITKRVMVSSMSKDRILGYENMFNVSLSIDKINR